MSKEDLKQSAKLKLSAIEVLRKAFNGGDHIPAHVVQAALAVVLTPGT